MIIGGIFAEVRRRLVTRGAIYLEPGGNPKMMEPYAADAYHSVLSELCRKAGVVVMHGVRVADARFEPDRATITLGDGQTLAAATVVDATGDATVAHAAGVPCRQGREGDGAVMPVTRCYLFGPVDIDALAEADPSAVCIDPGTGERFVLLTGPRPWLVEAVAADRAAGRLSIPMLAPPAAISVPGDPTMLCVNYGRVDCPDPTDPACLREAECLADAQVDDGAAFLQRRLPGAAAARVRRKAALLGVRQTRQIVALHTLTGAEALACTQFDDVIAQCAYMVDVHEPGSDRTTIIRFDHGTHYDIPWRSLVPQTGPLNLIVAGRCIGADTMAMSSFRVQPSVTAIGEAAGVTAALAAHHAVPVRQVDVAAVQAELLAHGGILS